MQHPSDDDLALVALGEHVDLVEEHVHDCPGCSSELRALSAAASTARRADLSALPPPPPSVWDRISTELGLEEPVGDDRVVTPLRPSWHRRALATAAGAAAVAAAAALFLTVGSPFGSSTPDEGPSVPLQALGDTQATGRVVLASAPEQRSLLVDTAGLPARTATTRSGCSTSRTTGWSRSGPSTRAAAAGWTSRRTSRSPTTRTST